MVFSIGGGGHPPMLTDGRPLSATPVNGYSIAVWWASRHGQLEQWRVYQAPGLGGNNVPDAAEFVDSVTVTPDYPGAVPVITHVFAERVS